MVGDVGDAGNVGDVGNLGGSGSGGGGFWVVPDRIDLPFVTIKEKTWDATTKTWSDGSRDINALSVTPANNSWDYKGWGANWWAWQVLIAFSGTDWKTAITVAGPPKPLTDQHFNDLIAAAEDERTDALGEIVAQNESYTDIAAYFMVLLRMTDSSHPATYRLLHIAGLIGILTSMHFKMEHKHPRPSQLRPALFPPVPVPKHPSYPSGHATPAMLMALVVEEAMVPKTGPATLKGQWLPLLRTLAHRIAVNREIAGLHFSFDSDAGTKLAADTFAILNDDQKMGTTFRQVMVKAKEEWL